MAIMNTGLRQSVHSLLSELEKGGAPVNAETSDLLEELARALEREAAESKTPSSDSKTHASGDAQTPPPYTASNGTGSAGYNSAGRRAVGLGGNAQLESLLQRVLERCTVLERRVRDLDAHTKEALSASARPAPAPAPVPAPHAAAASALSSALEDVSVRRLMALESELGVARARIIDLTSQLQETKLDLARSQAREAKYRERADAAEASAANMKEIEANLRTKYASVLTERQQWQKAAADATAVAERAEAAVRSLASEAGALRPLRAEVDSLRIRLVESNNEAEALRSQLSDAFAAQAPLRTLAASLERQLADRPGPSEAGPGAGTAPPPAPPAAQDGGASLSAGEGQVEADRHGLCETPLVDLLIQEGRLPQLHSAAPAAATATADTRGRDPSPSTRRDVGGSTVEVDYNPTTAGPTGTTESDSGTAELVRRLSELRARHRILSAAIEARCVEAAYPGDSAAADSEVWVMRQQLEALSRRIHQLSSLSMASS